MCDNENFLKAQSKDEDLQVPHSMERPPKNDNEETMFNKLSNFVVGYALRRRSKMLTTHFGSNSYCSGRMM